MLPLNVHLDFTEALKDFSGACQLVVVVLLERRCLVVETVTSHARRFLVLVEVALERESFATSSADVRLLA